MGLPSGFPMPPGMGGGGSSPAGGGSSGGSVGGQQNSGISGQDAGAAAEALDLASRQAAAQKRFSDEDAARQKENQDGKGRQNGAYYFDPGWWNQ